MPDYPAHASQARNEAQPDVHGVVLALLVAAVWLAPPANFLHDLLGRGVVEVGEEALAAEGREPADEVGR